MAWSFPIPLGGAPGRARQLYSRWILTRVPPWLRRGAGGKILAGIGDLADYVIDSAAVGVKLRFPGTDDAALAVLGQERGIVRGPTETADVYASRVRQWRQSNRLRGSVYAMLDQWHAYQGSAPYVVDVLYRSGTYYRLAVDGTITRLSQSASTAPPGWASFVAIQYLPSDPGIPLTDAEKQAYSVIPRSWNAAHISGATTALVWGDEHVLGEPGLTLGQLGLVLGSDAVVVDA